MHIACKLCTFTFTEKQLNTQSNGENTSKKIETFVSRLVHITALDASAEPRRYFQRPELRSTQDANNNPQVDKAMMAAESITEGGLSHFVPAMQAMEIPWHQIVMEV